MTQSNNVSLREKAAIWYNTFTLEEARLIFKRHLPEYKFSEKTWAETNFSEKTWAQIEAVYLKEHPTEAEVSKEEETVEDAAIKYSELAVQNVHDKQTELQREAAYLDFKAGANWQKEKDRALIEELKSSLEYLLKCNEREYMKCEKVDAINKSKQAITKAEQHLKIK